MEDFAQFLQRYDFLLRKVLVHMRIYANFDEFYHLATIALWQSACTYHVERGVAFEKYAFLKIKYALSDELTKKGKREATVLVTDEAHVFERVQAVDEVFEGEWFEQLKSDEQQLLQYIFVYGYTNEEVGRLFGVGEEAIKKRRQRLLRKLKQGLMEDSNMIL